MTWHIIWTKNRNLPDAVCKYFLFTADLEIRVSALEEIVLDQSASIQSLQENDVEIEQRVEDLEVFIIGESKEIIFDIVMSQSVIAFKTVWTLRNL